ncbi:hypothetical protein ACJMK2_039596 [Sinanodonta woodiana]|uniref:Uncharacterized protein n=1 Tax=Sinanodonta woodiana TaxID=1069815 RepID=A0ABD3WDM8_SINWO
MKSDSEHARLLKFLLKLNSRCNVVVREANAPTEKQSANIIDSAILYLQRDVVIRHSCHALQENKLSESCRCVFHKAEKVIIYQPNVEMFTDKNSGEDEPWYKDKDGGKQKKSTPKEIVGSGHTYSSPQHAIPVSVLDLFTLLCVGPIEQ